jgi:hypothetical protein
MGVVFPSYTRPIDVKILWIPILQFSHLCRYRNSHTLLTSGVFYFRKLVYTLVFPRSSRYKLSLFKHSSFSSNDTDRMILYIKMLKSLDLQTHAFQHSLTMIYEVPRLVADTTNYSFMSLPESSSFEKHEHYFKPTSFCLCLLHTFPLLFRGLQASISFASFRKYRYL